MGERERERGSILLSAIHGNREVREEGMERERQEEMEERGGEISGWRELV